MDLHGFVHGENYINVKRGLDSKGIIKSIKKSINKYDWNILSENAYNLVKDNHTTDTRIKQLLELANG